MPKFLIVSDFDLISRGITMIFPEDVEFHTPIPTPVDWAETNFFGFYIPNQRIMGSIYTVARPGVGACVSDIVIYGGLSADRLDALHYDVGQHFPLPESLGDYSFSNGLRVHAIKPPRDYQIDYVGRNGVEFHLNYRGLMEPFDIHDSENNPRSHSEGDRDGTSGHGAAYRNHFDMSAHVTGELILNGHRMDIDCIDTMDHSWGPRTEFYQHQMGWIHAHFSENLALHVIVNFNTRARRCEQFQLAHGYILRDGQVHAIVDASFDVDRLGRQITALEIKATDTSGRSITVQGAAISGGPWICYLNQETQNILLRWVNNEGAVGYGAAQELYNVDGEADAHRAARFPPLS